LGRLLDRLMPDEPEAKGLLALMLLIHARHPARTTPDGELALLADQDRQSWDRRLIADAWDRHRTRMKHGNGDPVARKAGAAA
jgi:RNA polymerase sigma-70 factor, ECF subfamily